jgi:hypothetical protein
VFGGSDLEIRETRDRNTAERGEVIASFGSRGEGEGG